MNELTALPNIGEKLAAQLREAGIETAEELRRVGSREAWVRILSRDHHAAFGPRRGDSGNPVARPRSRNKSGAETVLSLI